MKILQATQQNGNAVEWAYPSPDLASWPSDHQERVLEALSPLHTFTSHLKELDATELPSDMVHNILAALVERAEIMLAQVEEAPADSSAGKKEV